jgi:hypothetical protein
MKSDEQLFKEAVALQRYGYVFTVSAREWMVAYNPENDTHHRHFGSERIILQHIRHFEDDGGSDSRNMEMLGRDNLIAAIQFANEHLRGRLARENHDRFMSRG